MKNKVNVECVRHSFVRLTVFILFIIYIHFLFKYLFITFKPLLAFCCNTLHLNVCNTKIFFNFVPIVVYYCFILLLLFFESRSMVLSGAAWGASRQRDALRPGLNVCVCLPLSPVVQSLLRESQVIRQTKEKQISELKKMSDQSAESLKNEWEKKVKKG